MNTVSPVRMTLVGGGLIAVTYGLARFVFGLFLPQIRAELGLSTAMAGLISALPFMSYIGAVLLAPAVARWFGVRAASAGVGLLALAGLVAIARAEGPVLLGLGVFVCGLSTGLSSPILAAGVQRLVRAQRRGRVNAAINAATSLGVAGAAPAALWWSEAWREAYTGFAVLAACAVLGILLALPRLSVSSSRAARMALPEVGRRAWRDILHFGGLAAAMGLVSAPYWIFAPDFAVNRGGLASGQSGWIWLAVGLGGLAGTWAGDLIDRHGPAISHGFALAGLSASLTLLASDPGHLGLAIVSAAVFGAAYMTLTGLYLVASVRIMPNRPALGPVIPLIGASAGQMAGSPVAGWLVAAQGYGTAFGLFSAIGLVMAVLSLALPAVTAEEPALDPE